MRALYFGSRYFASGFFGQAQPEFGGYFGARHFAGNYFGAGFYGPVTLSDAITATLDATEVADALSSSVTVPVEESRFGGFSVPYFPRFYPPIFADLDVKERPDTCEATATVSFDLVAIDNDLLLLAA